MGRALLFLFALWAAFCPDQASAAKRVARFFSMGINSSTRNFNASKIPTSSCTIVLRNPSENDQSYEIVNISLTSSTPGGIVKKKGVLGPATLTKGSETIIVWEFPRHPGTAATSQIVSCGGSIVTWDTDPEARGYVVGSGTLATFTQSGKAGATAGQGFYDLVGAETFQQIPILVGEGHPF